MERFDPNQDPLMLVAGPVTPRPSRERITIESVGRPLASSNNGYPASPAPRRGVSVRRLLQTVVSRRRLIAAVAGCVLFMACLAILFLHPHYRSEAKLLVRLGRESVVIDPTARIGQSAVPMEGRDKEINSEIELLKSQKLVESIVGSLGTNRILSLSDRARVTPQSTGKAVTLVEEKLAVEAVPDSNILSIQYEARDPEVARDVIAKLIDVYLDERAAIYREQGDLQFFQDQLASARAEQSDIQQQIQHLRDSSGVADTTQQRETLLKHIDEIQDLMDKDEADRLAEAAAINALSKQVGSAGADRQRQTQMTNDALLQSTIESLKTQKSEALVGLTKVNQVEVEMQNLQQSATLSAARVTQYAEAYEQTRIDREMGKQRLSNISVAEPPTLPLSPKAPSRGLLAIAGLFLAITLGLGSAFIAEAIDHTVRRAEDLTSLGLSRTVSIPLMSPNQLKPRYKRWRLPKTSQASDDDRDVIDAEEYEGSEAVHESTEINGTVPQTGSNGTRNNGLSSNVLGVNELSTNGVSNSGAGRNSNGNGVATINVVGVAIRAAGPLGISPAMLESVQGVAERLIPVGAYSPPCLIAVVAPRSNQGSTTIAFNLAVALSQQVEATVQSPDRADRVLLLDADINKNRASEMAGVPVIPRAVEDEFPDLTGQIPLSSITSPAGNHRLDVLTTGLRQMNRTVLWAQMPQLLRALKPRYRHIVIDLPSLEENQVSARLAGLCDTVVLVTKADDLRVETAQHAVNRLREAQANVAVAVLNQRSYVLPEWIYRRS